MQLLQPEVLSERAEPDVAQLQLRIPPELDYFAGHFAGFPILPGVVQLNWAIDYARRLFAVEGAFEALDNLKFQAPIRPDLEVLLQLRWDGEQGRLEFAYSDGARRYSSGRVHFAKTSDGAKA
jgi:3-hydroxymyristoyl/3-hydroxydecanoyl-(acyl carrier protein) dehydratase